MVAECDNRMTAIVTTRQLMAITIANATTLTTYVHMPIHDKHADKFDSPLMCIVC